MDRIIIIFLPNLKLIWNDINVFLFVCIDSYLRFGQFGQVQFNCHLIETAYIFKSKAKPKKEGIVYPEFIRDDSDNDDDYDEETEYLKLRDFDKRELMDFNYNELDIEFADRPLDIDSRNDADYKDDYNDEYEYNSD